MINTKWKNLQTAVLLIIVILVMICVSFINHSFSYNPEDYCVLNENWDVTINDTFHENVNLKDFYFKGTDKGDYLKLETVLPSQVVDNPVIRFYPIYSVVSMKLGDKQIYEYGRELYEQNKLLGYGYQYVVLPKNYQGQTLVIELWVTENNAFTSIKVPDICNQTTMLRDFMRKNIVPLVINMFLIVFGICMFAVSISFVIHNRSFSSLLCVAGFSTGIGCWSLCSYDLITLFAYRLETKVYIEFIALYISPIFFLLYFWRDAMGKKRILRLMYYTALGAQSIFIVAVLVLLITNVVHLPALLFYLHIILLLTFFFVFAEAISDIVRRRVENMALMIGSAIMIGIGLVDILAFNLRKYFLTGDAEYTSNLCIGTLVFVLAQMIDFCLKISRNLYEAAKQEALEKMAYTDEMTGLFNRRKCEEEWEKVEEAENYGILAFDLNNLKKTNDKMGHERGDILIRGFADCLKKAFGEYGIVGRMGGDEFIVIFPDMFLVNLDNLLVEYKKYEAALNEQDPMLGLSAAYGFCTKSEEPGMDAKEIYRKADARMYEQKVAMKCARVE